MIHKRILVPDRVRRPPTDGGRGLIVDFCGSTPRGCRTRRSLLYFFLAAVSDKDGLSFYSDATIAVRLRISETAVVARGTS